MEINTLNFGEGVVLLHCHNLCELEADFLSIFVNVFCEDTMMNMEVYVTYSVYCMSFIVKENVRSTSGQTPPA